jgi:hypothetical protein
MLGNTKVRAEKGIYKFSSIILTALPNYKTNLTF